MKTSKNFYCMTALVSILAGIAAGLFLGDEQLKVQEDRAPSWRPPSSRLLDAGSGEVQQVPGLELKPLKNFEKQLTGVEWMNSFPENTPAEKREKRIYANNCSGCHAIDIQPGNVEPLSLRPQAECQPFFQRSRLTRKTSSDF